MVIIKSFNDTIRYIENVLDDEIDEAEITRLSTYSYAMFSRLFSILTNMTLSEYMRLRKLSKAAIEIRSSDIKIIDVAIKYGYESSDAFTYAFKLFHGVTPSDVRRGLAYKVISPIQLSLSVRGGKDMEVTIQRKKSIYVCGVLLENIDAEQCSNAWLELYKRYSHKELSPFGNGKSYGVCLITNEANKLNYMASYDIRKSEIDKKMNLDFMEIEETEYAIIKLKGKVPECIQEGWKYAMEVFFPEEGYRHSGKPDLEVYFEGDMKKENYSMELWIPVKKEN